MSKGHSLALAILSLAVGCLGIGITIQNPAGLQGVIGWVFISGGFILAGYAFALFRIESIKADKAAPMLAAQPRPDTKSEPEQRVIIDATPPEQRVIIDATPKEILGLWKQHVSYDAEQLFINRYQGRWIEAIATVDDIAMWSAGVMVVYDFANDTALAFDPAHELRVASLKKGSRIRVRGKIKDRFSGLLNLSHCEFLPLTE
jgi:hypothetical protein